MDRGWQNWKLTIAYDGGDFHGWQVQQDRVTVQGTLADALEHVTGERVLPQGAGRTDAGVHALGQVASCHLRAPIPAENLERALNRLLPPAIRVMSVEPAAPHFHARHSARGKTYEYRVYRGRICPPTLVRYVHVASSPLNLCAMHAAAQCVIGEHDFRAFAAAERATSTRNPADTAPAGTAQPSTVRRVNSSAWEERPLAGAPGCLLVYRVHGNAFLHHMVRNLVGTFFEVGRGRYPAETVRSILASRNRAAAGSTAPASGLFLISVDYEAPS